MGEPAGGGREASYLSDNDMLLYQRRPFLPGGPSPTATATAPATPPQVPVTASCLAPFGLEVNIFLLSGRRLGGVYVRLCVYLAD